LKVKELIDHLDCRLHAEGRPDEDVYRGVAGDLLSHVMGAAPEGSCWVTIQTHVNVAAVAVLKEMPLVILASDREPAPDLVERCLKEGICLVSTPLSIFEVCSRLGNLGIEG